MHEAVYVASVDKIFGTSGPWVYKCNASTGALESKVRVSAPLYGEMRICYNLFSDALFVAAWNEPNDQALSQPNLGRDVFRVTPAGLVVTGLAVNTWIGDDFNNDPSWGPRWIGSSGSNIYFMFQYSGGATVMNRVNSINFADFDAGGDSTLRFSKEQVGIDDANAILYIPDARDRELDGNLMDFSSTNQVSVIPHHPIGAELYPADGNVANYRVYCVCGNGNLLKVNWNTLTFIGAINLNADPPISLSTGNADPCRIRWRASNSRMYLPCPTANAVIVYDPSSDTGVMKTGFSNPVDCVFTGSKAFAVQQSPVGLLEIT